MRTTGGCHFQLGYNLNKYTSPTLSGDTQSVFSFNKGCSCEGPHTENFFAGGGGKGKIQEKEVKCYCRINSIKKNRNICC